MSKPLGPYTPVVRAGDFLIVSGQTGAKDGQLVPGGLDAQVRTAMASLASLLDGAGASLAAVVKTTVFLTNMSDFAAMNAIYAEIFGDTRPARSTVGVAGLPLGACFEIEAWAYAPAARGAR